MSRQTALEKKISEMHFNNAKISLELLFWKKQTRFYAPNRMDQHYRELDEQLKDAGLFTGRKESTKKDDNE